MDGNNRWSKKNNLSYFDSYKKGAETLIRRSNFLFYNRNIEYISAFALSTNNLKRNKKILNAINSVLLYSLDKYSSSSIIKFKIKFLGNLNFLPNNILNKINLIQNQNINSKKTLNIFLNFGGQEEIVELINFFKKENIKVSIDNIHKYFFKDKYNSPEILIRTGGFKRLSNFILYQISFTELFFLKKLWPDINNTDLDKIINKYYLTDRKFGI